MRAVIGILIGVAIWNSVVAMINEYVIRPMTPPEAYLQTPLSLFLPIAIPLTIALFLVARRLEQRIRGR